MICGENILRLNASLKMSFGTTKIQQMDIKNNINIGEILKTKRESFNLGIEEISRSLKVKASDIILLEQNTVNLINSRIYLPGLVRQYAKILEIKDDVINQYLENIMINYNAKTKQYQSIDTNKEVNKIPSKSDLLYATLIFLAISFILIFFSPIKTKNLAMTDLIINQFKQQER